MTNIFIIFALFLIAGIIILYLIKKKKSGVKCIGCPYAEKCNKNKCGTH